jgi:arginine deiminase
VQLQELVQALEQAQERVLLLAQEQAQVLGLLAAQLQALDQALPQEEAVQLQERVRLALVELEEQVEVLEPSMYQSGMFEYPQLRNHYQQSMLKYQQ